MNVMIGTDEAGLSVVRTVEQIQWICLHNFRWKIIPSWDGSEKECIFESINLRLKVLELFGVST